MIYEGRYKLITIERKHWDKVFYLLSPTGQIVLLNEPREATTQNNVLPLRETSTASQPMSLYGDELIRRVA